MADEVVRDIGDGDRIAPSDTGNSPLPPSQPPDAWLPPPGRIADPASFETPPTPPLFVAATTVPPAGIPPHLATTPVAQASPTSAALEVDQLTWRQFELAMAEAFTVAGYGVTVTPDGADGGIDLILTRPGEYILVQCKHWAAWKVGVKTVRELYGVMTAQGATGGIVATSGRFTQEARAFAHNVNIQLLGRRDVTRMLDRLPPQTITGLINSRIGTPPAPGHGPRCPRCGEAMVLRTARRGQTSGDQFWGCPRYPACRGMMPLGPSTSTPPTWFPPPTVPTAGPATASADRPDRAWRTPSRSRRTVAARIALLSPLVFPMLILGGGFLLWSTITASIPRQVSAPIPSGRSTSPAKDPRIIATIPLTAKPFQLAVDPDARRLYVTHVEAKSLTIIDLTKNTVLSTVALDRQPGAIAFDSKTQTLWVTNYNDASVTLLDTTGKTKAVLQVGQGPVGVAVDPGLQRAYVTNNLAKTFNVIDTTKNRIIATETRGYAPGAVVVDPVKHRVCIVHTTAFNRPYCYDTALKLTDTPSPGGEAIAIDTVTLSRYATTASKKSLDIVDGTTGKTTSIPLGTSASGVAVDPTTHLAYVTDHDAQTILVIKTA